VRLVFFLFRFPGCYKFHFLFNRRRELSWRVAICKLWTNVNHFWGQGCLFGTVISRQALQMWWPHHRMPTLAWPGLA
jgi:hypothetical protein